MVGKTIRMVRHTITCSAHDQDLHNLKRGDVGVVVKSDEDLDRLLVRKSYQVYFPKYSDVRIVIPGEFEKLEFKDE